MRVLVSGAQTGGRYAVVELHERCDIEHPLHLHTREDQFIYILEGHVTVHLGEEKLDCPAGSSVVLPQGREHTLRVESREARLLVFLLPAWRTPTRN